MASHSAGKNPFPGPTCGAAASSGYGATRRVCKLRAAVQDIVARVCDGRRVLSARVYVSDVTMFGLRIRPRGVDFVVSLGPISWFCGSKSVTVFWAQKRRHILVLVLFLWW